MWLFGDTGTDRAWHVFQGRKLGLYRAILIILLFWGGATAEAGAGRCLGCHPPHYAEQGSCVRCHLGDDRSSRKELAHSGLVTGQYASFTDPRSLAVRRGGTLAEQAACRRCHGMAGTGNPLAANLDRLFRTTSPSQIRTAITAPAQYMPEFHFSDQALDYLVTAVLAGGFQQVGKLAPDAPQVVHFSADGIRQQNVFTRHCGGCHRLLSADGGGLGSGSAGPNLSGLLTRYYPAGFAGQHPWTEHRLRRWLTNPRRVKPFAVMRPVSLKADEFAYLVKLLASSP